MRDVANYPGIRKASLAIGYDNGMINRFFTQEQFLATVTRIISAGEYDEHVDAIEAWLSGLSDSDLETFCTGEADDIGRIAVSCPPKTEDLTEEIFES